MPKRTHPRNLFAKRLRAAIAGEQLWNIHPPKIDELNALAERAHLPVEAAEVHAQFGVQADDPSRMQRVGSVAVLPITGMIQPASNYITRYFGGTSLEQLEKDFRAALTDSQVTAIVLFVDSYGGSASQNDEVSKAIYNARGRKPILAFVRGACCSAGYYLASAADSIVASSSSLIGSVGTIAIHTEYAQYLEQLGIQSTVITFGKNKGHGNTVEKLSPEAKATLQKTVDDFGTMFVGAVARNRGVTPEKVAEKFGQGQAFLAAEARTRGMIDRVGTWEQVLSGLKAGPAPLPEVERENKSESATAAGASAVVSSVSPPAKPAGQEVSSVDPKIKAMLFARGMISSIDANDEECKVALRSYFAGRNEAQPATPEATVVALMAMPQQQAAAPPPQANSGQAPPTTPPPAPQPDAAAIAAAAQQRVLDLQAAGAELGIDAAGIDAAVKGGQTYEVVAAGWLKNRTTTHKPVGGARVTGEGAAQFVVDGANAYALKLGYSLKSEERNPHVERMSAAPLSYFAEESLRLAGVRFDQFATKEDIAELAMQQGGYERVRIGASSPVNRPGDFPNLLSNLMNKIFDEGIERSEATWDQWCGRFKKELPDFKPAPIVGKSQTNQMDQVHDSEEFKELSVVEELLSMIQLDRYGNSVGLTPVMVANDDVEAFTEDAFNLQDAWEMTINRLGLSLLTGNVLMLNGNQLFSAGNANIITPTGAAPSAAQWEAMNLIYGQQRTIGNTGYQRGSLRVALVSNKWEVPAEQTFMTLIEAGETKNPVTDSTINVYRKKKVQVVVEPELQAYGSGLPWYGLADPTRRPVVKVGFMAGYGRKGRRERWYDPKTKCQHFSLEGRVGAAATHYRNGVYNPGQ